MKEIKFRVWDKKNRKMFYQDYMGFLQQTDEDLVLVFNDRPNDCYVDEYFAHTDQNGFNVMQYTGLKDKNGLKEIYEGDIIDINGNLVGNIYENNKRESDFIIQGFGTKNWCTTYQKAMERGCKNSE